MLLFPRSNTFPLINNHPYCMGRSEEENAINERLRDLSFRYETIKSDLIENDVPDTVAALNLIGVSILFHDCLKCYRGIYPTLDVCSNSTLLFNKSSWVLLLLYFYCHQ